MNDPDKWAVFAERGMGWVVALILLAGFGLGMRWIAKHFLIPMRDALLEHLKIVGVQVTKNTATLKEVLDYVRKNGH